MTGFRAGVVTGLLGRRPGLQFSLSVPAMAGLATCRGEAVTVTGTTAGADTLVGDPRDAVIAGGHGNGAHLPDASARRPTRYLADTGGAHGSHR
jgi:hypothetical protein